MKRILIVCTALSCIVLAFLLSSTPRSLRYSSHWIEGETEWVDPSSMFSLSTEEQVALFEQVLRLPDEQALARDAKHGRNTSSLEPWVQRGPWGILHNTDPNIHYSGRVNALAFTPWDVGGLYVGGANGGLWLLSSDPPQSLADNLPSIRVSALAISPSNPQIVFLGTGDYDGGIDGAGVYRSLDGGSTWDKMNTVDVAQPSRIIVRGHDVYVAGRRNLYVSGSDGDAWNKLLSKRNICDLAVASDDSYILAAVRGRGIWRSSSGPGLLDSISISKFEGWNPTTVDRIAMAMSPSSPNTAYIQVGQKVGNDHSLMGIYKTTNAGITWSRTNVPYYNNVPSDYFGLEFACNVMIVHPTNPNIVWSGGGSLWRSSDGGNSWSCAGACPGQDPHPLHGDMHALLYVGNRLYVGSDGGVFYTDDEGATWQSQFNKQLPLTQIYNFDVYLEGGNLRCGGTQDNGMISVTSADADEWSLNKLCDGNDAVIDQMDPSLAIVTCNSTHHVKRPRCRIKNGVEEDIEISATMFAANDTAFDWFNTFVARTPHAPLGIFTNASDHVYWSTNSGVSWIKLPDPPFSPAPFPSVTKFAAAGMPGASLVVYAVYDKGNNISRYSHLGGESWTHSWVQGNGLPNKRPLKVCTSNICGTQLEIQSAFVVMDTTGPGQQIYRTMSYGSAWEDITGDLPENLFIHDITQVGSRIYLGTSYGVYVSTNSGTNWIRWTKGMPQAAEVRDLEVMKRYDRWYIVACTYGRSTFERPVDGMDPMFVAERMEAVRQWGNVFNGQIVRDSIHIFNKGEVALEILSARVSEEGMTVQPSDAIIAAGESLKFYITVPIRGRGIGKLYPSVEFVHNGSGSPTRIAFETYVGDDTHFRTFEVESLYVKKEFKRKTESTSWCFDFDNTYSVSTIARELTVEFASPVLGFASSGPFEESTSLDSRGKIWKFSGGSVPGGATVSVCVLMKGSRKQSVKRWWWTSYRSTWDGGTERWESVILAVNGAKSPRIHTGGMHMPNTANFRKEVFARGGITKDRPLVVGVADAAAKVKRLGYVSFAKEGDLIGSLMPGRSGKKHIGAPRPFGYYDNGRQLYGRIRKLTPDKHSNRLFAELMALKLNILGSVTEITPAGFGELRYVDPGHPLHGSLVRQIDSLADKYMTYGDSAAIGSALALDSVVHKINAAFVGPLDTVGFSGRLQFTGVRPIAEVPYLERDSTVLPMRLAFQTQPEVQPEIFELFQNYPNPFNPTTTIEFELPTTSIVTLKIFNYLGQLVATVVDRESMDDGSQAIEFDASGMASGVYLYQLTARPTASEVEEEELTERIITKKMILIK